jgi:hypothetical protein
VLLREGEERFGGLFRSTLPAIRTAIAYPGAARGRTGLTIAMFSLIVFSLVMIATMNENYVNLFLGDEANAGWHVRADVYSANPIDDFTGAGVASADELRRRARRLEEPQGGDPRGLVGAVPAGAALRRLHHGLRLAA